MLSRLHGGNIWLYRKKVIDFSANINPLGLSPRAKRTIQKNISALVHYPDPQAMDLKNTIAAFHSINQNNILVGNGSIEFIHLIPRALKVKNVLIAGPTFSEYEFAASSNSAKSLFVLAQEKDDFKIDILKVKKFIPKVDLIFLCNPNNPTAFLMAKSEILGLFDLCKRYNTALVIDEAFMDFVPNAQEVTLVKDAIKYDRLLVIRSLTKFFALAGLRLGYLIGQRSIIERIAKFQYPWNVNSLGQIAAREVLKDRDYIKLTEAFILRERNYLFEGLKKIKGLKVYNPSANFIFCKLESCKLKDSLRLNKELLKSGIIIRCCDNFRGLNNRFFRVAVRTRSENKKLIFCLKGLLE